MIRKNISLDIRNVECSEFIIELIDGGLKDRIVCNCFETGDTLVVLISVRPGESYLERHKADLRDSRKDPSSLALLTLCDSLTRDGYVLQAMSMTEATGEPTLQVVFRRQFESA